MKNVTKKEFREFVRQHQLDMGTLLKEVRGVRNVVEDLVKMPTVDADDLLNIKRLVALTGAEVKEASTEMKKASQALIALLSSKGIRVVGRRR